MKRFLFLTITTLILGFASAVNAEDVRYLEKPLEVIEENEVDHNQEYYDSVVPDYMSDSESEESELLENETEVFVEGDSVETVENEQEVETEEEEKKPIIKRKLTEISDQNFADNVTIQGLDKITAKISNITSPIGEDIVFDRLTIKVIKCWKAPPEQKPENKALVKIIEKTLEGEEKEVFYGWMFSENRSISGLDHPIYDVNIVDCAFDEKEKLEEMSEKADLKKIE